MHDEAPETTLGLVADLVEGRARDVLAVSPLPWEVRGQYRREKGCRCLSCHEPQPYAFEVWPVDPVDADEGRCFSMHLKEADARWMALASPSIADPLAAILRTARLAYERGEVTPMHEHALALATALLAGGAS